MIDVLSYNDLENTLVILSFNESSFIQLLSH